MRPKNIILNNFTRTLSSNSLCIRPDNEKELLNYLSTHQPKSLLTRGAGLSYSDCCLNPEGLTINTERFNHFISFDSSSGLVVCQAGITFKELLNLHPDFTPAVLPGTLHATLAGGLSNDVHGKNNHLEYSFGHHIEWIELIVNNQILRCDRNEHKELFYASIAGLGLTGVITRLAVRLKKASHFVKVKNESFNSIAPLLERMMQQGINYDYQVAWLDLLHEKPRALLSLANHCSPFPLTAKAVHSVPSLPFSLINKWTMKYFNKYHFLNKKPEENLSIEEFNNPLDKLKHWNRLYGKKGLLQFQAVFPSHNAASIIEQLLSIIKKYKAIPTLAVLKLFTHPGEGLLSFCTPGFTLALDFANNPPAQQAIKTMNQLMVANQTKVYLAKDLFLTTEQYESMYEQHTQFAKLLKEYHSPMHSALARRLGIIK